MSLSDDQRAMLQLLLEGGEGYGELATLLGVPEAQVRARASGALRALGATESADFDELTDYLLGQADPGSVRAVEAQLAADPGQLTEARRLHARLRLLHPNAALPALPEPGRTVPQAPAIASPPAQVAAPTPAAPEPEATAEPNPAPEPEATAETEPIAAAPADPSLNPQQKKLLAALVGTGLVIVIVVLALAGTFSGDDSSAGSEGETTAATRSDGEIDETALTRAVLQPQNGANGAGAAIFGALDEQTPVLQVTARNLAPTKKGEKYSVWLYQTDEIALPLANLEVGRNGRIATQIKLPPEALNFIVDGTLNQIDVSLIRKRAYQQELNASQSEGRLPRRIGTSVLRGRITGPGLTGAGNR